MATDWRELRIFTARHCGDKVRISMRRAYRYESQSTLSGMEAQLANILPDENTRFLSIDIDTYFCPDRMSNDLLDDLWDHFCGVV
jgi:hypothetical protein